MDPSYCQHPSYRIRLRTSGGDSGSSVDDTVHFVSLRDTNRALDVERISGKKVV